MTTNYLELALIINLFGCFACFPAIRLCAPHPCLRRKGQFRAFPPSHPNRPVGSTLMPSFDAKVITAFRVVLAIQSSLNRHTVLLLLKNVFQRVSADTRKPAKILPTIFSLWNVDILIRDSLVVSFFFALSLEASLACFVGSFLGLRTINS